MNSHKIGQESEDLVLKILQTKDVPSWIVGPCWKTKHSSPDDQKGIDLWVGTTAGFIPLQIKSSYSSGGKKSRRRNFYYSKGIGYVVTKSHSKKIKSDNQLFNESVEEIKRLFDIRQQKFCKPHQNVLL